MHMRDIMLIFTAIGKDKNFKIWTGSYNNICILNFTYLMNIYYICFKTWDLTI